MVWGKYLFFISFIVLVTILLSSLIPNLYESVAGIAKVSRIPVTGMISFGSSLLEQSADVNSLIEKIDAAENDPEVQAIVFDINSGGGYPVASFEIVSRIKRMTKPSVAIIYEIGASGAYWLASACDYIIASPVSMTGSIGAALTYLEFSSLLEEYNVTYVRGVSGEQKDFGSPYKSFSSADAERLDKIINESFSVFFKDVVNNRNLSAEQSNFISSGAVLLGSEAFELNLVDELGGSFELKEYLKTLLGANDISFVEYSDSVSLLQLLSSYSSNLPVGFFLKSAIPVLG